MVLIDERKKAVLKIQSALLYKTREFFYKRGFYELMPVLLSRYTDPLLPDQDSSVVKVGEVEYLGEKYKLTQSMILHKQVAISSGLDKIAIFSPNVRLERAEKRLSGKHLFEFTQVDFEIVYARKEDVFTLVEEFLIEVWKWLSETCKEEFEFLDRKLRIPTGHLKVYTSHDLIDKFGDEWEVEASLSERYPFWVICFKREFYDKEDPAKPGHFLNYDLIYPEGYGEALSGGEREIDIEKIRSRIREIGKEEEYREYIEMAKKGFVPSAGGGFGIERMVRFLTGTKHIKDVQVFPRVPGEKSIL